MPHSNSPSPRVHHVRERGIGLVEVLIASVLLILVSGAFLQLVVGSTNAASSQKVRQQQQATATTVLEQLRLSNEWTDECTTANCTVDLPKQFIEAAAANGSGTKFGISGSATGRDSDADGLGAADEDGIVTDYYDVTVRVAAPKGVLGAHDLTTTTMVDPNAGEAMGIVNLQVCGIDGQTDDNVILSSCASSVPLSGGNATGTPAPDTNEARVADTLAAAPAPLKFVAPAGLRQLVDLTEVGAVGTPRTFQARTNGDGNVTIPRVPAGQYAIQTAAPVGMSLWTTSSTPSLRINVEPMQTVDARVVFRRDAGADVVIALKTGDPALPSALVDGASRDVRIKLLPAPGNRVPLASALTTAPKGATSITITAPAPGLYQPWVVNGSNGLERLVGADYIHVGASSTTPLPRVATYVTRATPGNAAPVELPDEPPLTGDDTLPPYAPVDTVPYTSPIPFAGFTCVFNGPVKTAALKLSLCGVCNIKLSRTAFNASDVGRTTVRCAAGGLCDQTLNTTGKSGNFEIVCFALGSCKQKFETAYFSSADGNGIIECYPGGTCNQTLDILGSAKPVRMACYENASCKQTLRNGSSGGTKAQLCFPRGACVQTMTGFIGNDNASEQVCYEGAACTQTADYTFRSDTKRQLCFAGSTCKQMMDAFGETAKSAQVCYENAACDQSLKRLFSGTQSDTVQNCMKDARCNQVLSTWASGTYPALQLCYEKGACAQRLDQDGQSLGNTQACFKGASCKQYGKAFFTDGSIDQRCMELGTCDQSLSSTFAVPKFRQYCYPKASCKQFIDTLAPHGSIDQFCWPKSDMLGMAVLAEGEDCTAAFKFSFWTWRNRNAVTQLCVTAGTCTQTIKSFIGRADANGQRCISRGNCDQTYDVTFMQGDGFQECVTTATCKQRYDHFGGQGGEAKQVCDSALPCDQWLKQTFGADKGIKQWCNRTLSFSDPGGESTTAPPVVEEEPKGDYGENQGSGGA